MQRPDVVTTVPSLRAQVSAWRKAGERIALVPTMGALHEGHVALARRGRQEADRVVVSIFVNPRQFGPGEDFLSYPRGEDRDRDLLTGSADLVFLPTPAIMYPDGFATTVTVAGPSAGFEGDIRPGHFAGVATVVAKLFVQCLPDIAVFGEKDWQQLQVVTRMARDLDLPVRVVAHPTVRDEQGLALSSRNARLSPAEIATARRFNAVLAQVRRDLATLPVAEAVARGLAALGAAGIGPVDYLALVDSETLAPLERPPKGRPGRLLAAARLGPVRLLDNLAVPDGDEASAGVNHPQPQG